MNGRLLIYFLLTASYMPFFNMTAIAMSEDETEEVELDEDASDQETDTENNDTDLDEDGDGEISTKTHVRSIVDSLLKINNDVDPVMAHPKVKNIAKVNEQISKLRSDIKDLERSLEGFGPKNSSSNKDKNTNTPKKIKKSSAAKKRSHSYGHNRNRRQNIYTVKHFNVGYSGSNKYLDNIRNNINNIHIYRIKNHGKALSSSSKPSQFKYKYYGKNQRNNALFSKKRTIKKKTLCGC